MNQKGALMKIISRMVSVAMTLVVCSAIAQAQQLASWEMPVPFPNGTGNIPVGNTYLPPNETTVGTQTGTFPIGGPAYAAGTPTFGLLAGNTSAILSAFHTSTASVYTSPSGNGTTYAFSSNNWSPNDYYQVLLPTTGFQNLQLSWSQARSSTGPSTFSLQMSTNGSSFTELTPYTVLQSGGGGAPGTWNTGTFNPLYSSTVALPLTAENQSQLFLRFVNVTGTASAAAGANRIDSITVTSVPEPASLCAAAASAGLSFLIIRRRRSHETPGVV